MHHGAACHLGKVPWPCNARGLLSMPLKPYRQHLDQLDSLILTALAERMRCVAALGPVKLALGLEAHDPKREALLHQGLRRQARRLGLNQTFITKLYRVILEESLRVQQSQTAQAYKAKPKLRLSSNP